MNEVSTIERDVARKSVAEMPSEADMIRVLQNSLYPGAKQESVALVLSYCRMNGLDPMLKPVHIVPRRIKTGQDKWEWREVLMPSIADYRIKAARSGEYGGKSEPEFGPVKEEKVGNVSVRYPEWCKITVRRIVQDQSRDFTALEYWLENYSTDGKSDAPNSMWQKRAFGQLAKCTESQALRMAFPEFSGGQPTVEEMDGKDGFHGQTIDHEPSYPAQEVSKPPRQTQRSGMREFVDSNEFDRKKAPLEPAPSPPEEKEDWISQVEREIKEAKDTPSKIDVIGKWAAAADTEGDIKAMARSPAIKKLAELPDNLTRIQAFLAAARMRLSKRPFAAVSPDGGFFAEVEDPSDGALLGGPFSAEVEWSECFLGYWEALAAPEAKEFQQHHAKIIEDARRNPEAKKLLARLPQL